MTEDDTPDLHDRRSFNARLLAGCAAALGLPAAHAQALA